MLARLPASGNQVQHLMPATMSRCMSALHHKLRVKATKGKEVDRPITQGHLQYSESASQSAISAAHACASTAYNYLKCLTLVVSRATPYLLQQSTAS